MVYPYDNHCTAGFSQKLSVYDFTCNYKVNPVGTDATPRFSWKLRSSQQNVWQTAYEIRVSGDSVALSSGRKLIWDTGKVSSDQSIHVPYGSDQVSGRRYYWQVRVWDNHGNVSAWSPVNFWETGLLHVGDWKARWIEMAAVTDGKARPVPAFGKTFETGKKVRSARLYITSHGLYEATINGQRVGDQYFTPGWTAYRHRIQYQTYDVTPLIRNGQNSTVVLVGDGWHRGNLLWTENSRNLYGKEVALLYQLDILYTDGAKTQILSDDSWQVSADGPVRYSDIYNGETLDLTRAVPSMEIASGWQPVRTVDYGYDKLIAPAAPPVRTHERIRPLSMTRTAEGDLIVDFGQNLVGWITLKIRGNNGDTVTLHHAEVLNKDGSLYLDNLRSAKQENKYILSGQEQWVAPRFTFQGFRYARIAGYDGLLDENSIAAVAVYSDMEKTGTFTSSDSLINQLQRNIVWGQKGNFLDVPTDCPQRDERLGWTGDAQVFFNTAAYNMDVSGFFTKWLADLKADQHANGNVPVVIPDVRSANNAGSAGWGDAATIIPWNFYAQYADIQLVDNQYSSMKGWVEYLRSVSKDNLWNSGSHYGDWLFYTMDNDRDGRAAITDKFLIAQVFYAASVQNLVRAADLLGKTADATMYRALLDDVKQAFMREYVTPSGRMVSNTQTAYVLALYYDMLPEALRQQAAQRLVDNIKAYKDHITTGFLGTPYICHVLTRFGYNDVAYTLLLQDTYPSWLYPVKMGATTIWERWDGIKPDGTFQTPTMNSFNHYAYGAVGEWMYKTVAGLSQDASSAGYKRLVIGPQPGGTLTSAAGELETPYGKAVSSWKKTGDQITLEVRIPENTQAKIVFPNADLQTVQMDGKPLILRSQEHILGSGMYHFTFRTK